MTFSSQYRSLAAGAPGNATTRIVGGVETGINEFPMMAGLVVLNTKKVECGATISELSMHTLSLYALCI